MCLNFLAEIFKLYEIDTRRVLPLGPRCRGAIESSGAGPPGPQARGTAPVWRPLCHLRWEVGRCGRCGRCTHVAVFARLYVLRVYKTPKDRPGK